MRPIRRPAVLTGLVALAFIALLVPPGAQACSCAGPDAYIPDLPTSTDQVAFVGTPHVPIAGRVPVTVAAWYGGPAPSPEVTIAVAGGDGASCGRDAPAEGFAHLFIVYRAEDGGYGLSLCDVAEPLDTEAGQRLAGQVAAVMGEPIPVADGPPATTDDLGATVASLAPTGLAILLGILVVGGLFVWVSRRDEV
jgi:hypothetical protein